MNILNVKSAREFRDWLIKNHDTASECYLELKRGCPSNPNIFYYVDAVYEALCFGWIDSTLSRFNNKLYQRFSPRSKNSSWTELNKERVRYLIYKNKMTEYGLKLLPNLNEEFVIDEKIKKVLIDNDCLEIFNTFPLLYQKIRVSYLLNYYNKDTNEYNKALDNFIKNTRLNKMYGQYDDYGRLNNYKEDK